MKTLRYLAIASLLALPALRSHAQYTQASAGLSSVCYNNGSVTANWVNGNPTSPIQPNIGGGPFPQSVPGAIDVNGNFTLNLGDVNQIQPNQPNLSGWNITACAKSGLTPACYTAQNVPVTGATMNVSSYFSGAPTACAVVGGITQLTGDVTAGPGTGSQAATLATVNSSPGTCGDATHSCQVTTDGKGRTTGQTAVPITAAGGTTAQSVGNSLTGTVGGTANAITLALTTTTASIPASTAAWFIPTATNTGAATITVSPLSLANITKCGTTPLVAGDLVAGTRAEIGWDATEWQLINPQNGACPLGTATYTALIGTGSDPSINLPTNASHIPSAGDLWNDGGSPMQLFFNNGAANVNLTSFVSGISLIGQQKLVSPASTISFSSIPSSYTNLLLVMTVRCNAALSGDSIYLQYNGDTSAHYVELSNENSVTTLTPTGATQGPVSQASAAFVTCGSSLAGLASTVKFDIGDYSGSTFAKVALNQSAGNPASSSDIFQQYKSYYWTGTAAISSILIGLTTGGDQFAAGTVATLYGY